MAKQHVHLWIDPGDLKRMRFLAKLHGRPMYKQFAFMVRRGLREMGYGTNLEPYVENPKTLADSEVP